MLFVFALKGNAWIALEVEINAPNQLILGAIATNTFYIANIESIDENSSGSKN
jgi:hypothetical protein